MTTVIAPDHEQVQLVMHGETVEVDADLRDLLTELWDANVLTDYSCQGGPPFVEHQMGNGWVGVRQDEGYVGILDAEDLGAASKIIGRHRHIREICGMSDGRLCFYFAPEACV